LIFMNSVSALTQKLHRGDTSHAEWEVFVDPIGYVIKSAGSSVHCNDIAPPRYKVGGKWYCSYPELREYHNPSMQPVDEVNIDPVNVNNIGLGKNIYTKKQLEEFVAFQDSQRTRKACLAETAELAYMGRNEKGEWGLALGAQAQLSLVDLVGMSFLPLYSVVGPLIFFLSLLPMVLGRLQLIVTVFLRVAIFVRYRGSGVGVLTAFWGTLFQLAVSPFNWIDCMIGDVAGQVGRMLDNEAAREPDSKETEEHSPENLRKKYPWWLNGLEGEEPATSPEKAESGDTVTLYEEETLASEVCGERRRRHHQRECPMRTAGVVDVVYVNTVL
jgi:hypothetical protein